MARELNVLSHQPKKKTLKKIKDTVLSEASEKVGILYCSE